MKLIIIAFLCIAISALVITAYNIYRCWDYQSYASIKSYTLGFKVDDEVSNLVSGNTKNRQLQKLTDVPIEVVLHISKIYIITDDDNDSIDEDEEDILDEEDKENIETITEDEIIVNQDGNIDTSPTEPTEPTEVAIIVAEDIDITLRDFLSGNIRIVFETDKPIKKMRIVIDSVKLNTFEILQKPVVLKLNFEKVIYGDTDIIINTFNNFMSMNPSDRVVINPNLITKVDIKPKKK